MLTAEEDRVKRKNFHIRFLQKWGVVNEEQGLRMYKRGLATFNNSDWEWVPEELLKVSDDDLFEIMLETQPPELD